MARDSPTVIPRKAHQGIVENPKDKAHRSAALTNPLGGLLRCIHAPVQEQQFRGFSGVFVAPHWRTLFVRCTAGEQLTGRFKAVEHGNSKNTPSVRSNTSYYTAGFRLILPGVPFSNSTASWRQKATASLKFVAQKSAFVAAQSSLACRGPLCQKPARILISPRRRR